MKVRDLYNAVGESTLSPDDECVVVESELGVTLEIVAPSPPVRKPASESTPASTPLDTEEDSETDG